jgi:rhamnose transport system substrate-binding protein
MKTTKFVRLFALLAALMLAIAACGTENGDTDAADDNGEEAADGEGMTLGFLPKDTGNQVFTVANEGAQDAGEELGHTVEFVGPSQPEVSQQVEWIENLIGQGVDAIMISALDPEATAPALQSAQEQDILTLAWDSDVSEDARSLFISPPSVEAIGEILAEMIGEQTGYEGEYAWLSTGPEVTNQRVWIEAAEEYMENNADQFGDMEMVRIAYGQDEDGLSYSETEGLLAAYPDLAGIVSPTTVGIAAAARAVQDAGMCGDVAVTGLGTPNEMRAFVEDGCSEAFALWDFAELGYLTVYAAHAILTGEIEGEQGETFEAGDLGEREVNEEGIVYVGDPLVFDEDNIDEYDF